MIGRNEFVGPWAGMPVAWRKDLSFDEETYRADVERACKAGVPGVYTGGTTGEFYAIEFEDFRPIAKATVEECRRHHTPVMIGVTHTSTLGAVRRAAYAREIGADAIQVALPFWMQVDDRDVVRFFAEVSAAAEGLSVSLYETMRAKKALTLAQHREVKKAVPAYLNVKAGEGTPGHTEDGCAALSEFVNVFVSEVSWAELGRSGAIGCASALVYMNPRVILRMWEHLRGKRWAELERECANLKRYYAGVIIPLAEKGYTDTAFDRLQGRACGFLKTSLWSRGGPYRSAAEEDVQMTRAWLEAHWPEFLKL